MDFTESADTMGALNVRHGGNFFAMECFHRRQLHLLSANKKKTRAA